MRLAGGSPRQRVTALCALAGPWIEEVRAMRATKKAPLDAPKLTPIGGGRDA